jgi:hypothetical protein
MGTEMHSLMTGRDFTSRPIGRKAALWLTGAAALALISGQGPPVQAAEPAPEAGNSEAPTAAKSAYRRLALIGLLRNQVAAVETEIAMLETELDSLCRTPRSHRGCAGAARSCSRCRRYPCEPPPFDAGARS